MGQLLCDARCRYCSCRNVWTSRFRLRDLIAVCLFNKRPLRCRTCKRRFYGRADVYFGSQIFNPAGETAPIPSSDQ